MPITIRGYPTIASLNKLRVQSTKSSALLEATFYCQTIIGNNNAYF